MGQNKNQKQIEAAFKTYQRMSTFTSKQFMLESIKIMTFTLTGILYLAFYLCLRKLVIVFEAIFLSFVFSMVLSFILALIAHAIIWLRNADVLKYERTHGYNKELVDKFYKLNRNKQKRAILVSCIYNYMGNPDLAIGELSCIDPTIFATSPANAHVYYMDLLMAYVLKGDMQRAELVHRDGFYFLNTYINSPLYGSIINITLAMYEYNCGHYDVSLNLLNNAYRLVFKDAREKDKIPQENQTIMIFYYQALNYVALNDKMNAIKTLEACKNLHSTQFYKNKVQMLLESLYSQEKTNGADTSNETIS